MPWQKHLIMNLREEFVLRANAPGSNLSELCREYEIARKTGYKWLARYAAGGLLALADVSRRPRRIAAVSGEVVMRLVELREAHPKWGPKKLHVLLLRELPKTQVPSVRTLARILDRLGVPRLRRVRKSSTETRLKPAIDAKLPNQSWTVDFKGWWQTKDSKRCDPLTIRDACSRYILRLELMTTTKTDDVKRVFVRVFEKYGLPGIIHVDNGAPFGSTRSRLGLSRLSVWWTALGIHVSFSRPATPADNGAHERMHRDISVELQASPAAHLKAQQRECDTWVQDFNHVRPHEALAMKTPASKYKRSKRPYREVVAPRYSIKCDVRAVRHNGSVRYRDREIFVGTAYAGYRVGIEVVDSKNVRIHFYKRDLGVFDLANAARNPRKKCV